MVNLVFLFKFVENGVFKNVDGVTGTSPIRARGRGVNSAAMRDDGGLLALVANDKTVRLWDLQSNEWLWKSSRKHDMMRNKILFSDDGRLLHCADLGGKISVWRVSHCGRDVSLLRTRHNTSLRYIRSLCTGGGSELFALHDNRVRVWDARVVRRSIEQVFHAFLPDVSNFAVSADGATMLTLNPRKWHLEKGNVCDVYGGTDHVIPSFETSRILRSESLAVSNNRLRVAYCCPFNSVLNIGDVLHSISNPQHCLFSPTPGQHDIPSSFTASRALDGVRNVHPRRYIESMRFNSEGSIVSAVVIQKACEEEAKITTSLSWDVESGELLDETQIGDNREASSGNASSTAICEERSPTLRVENSRLVMYEHDGESFTIATLENCVLCSQ